VSNNIYRQIITPTLSLFTSFSTLICCALPAFLVTVGMGAVLAGFVSNFPWIKFMTTYKLYIFMGAGLMLLFSGYIFWQGRNAPCPADPKQAKICFKLRKISFYILIISLFIYLIGFFFAYLAVHFI
jgi:hypothetical protein|tara:strand:- start:1106 stop:1486 length:381 start_codon:yes stop_codon:yes gene_type:complete